MPHAIALASLCKSGTFLATLCLASALLVAPGQVQALSELKTIGGDPVTPRQATGGTGLDIDSMNVQSGSSSAGQPTKTTPDTVEYSYDAAKLPEPVRKLREKLIEAAASGDPERLRPLLETGAKPTQIPAADDGSDPIDALKSLAGDPDGLEILAIMLDLLATGYAHVNPGAPDETYVWPYFSEKNIQSLSAPEKVELLRIVTAGDLMAMQEYGSYNFFQIGLTPDGRWKFLTAGD